MKPCAAPIGPRDLVSHRPGLAGEVNGGNFVSHSEASIAKGSVVSVLEGPYQRLQGVLCNPTRIPETYIFDCRSLWRRRRRVWRTSTFDCHLTQPWQICSSLCPQYVAGAP